MRKLMLSLLLAVSVCIQLSAYSWLYITDPRVGWGRYPANIEEAHLHIVPKGAFFVNELTMTISEQQGYHDEKDTLEIVYEFTLPEGSKIYESWLLIEETMVRAELRDVWTAQAIYEGIVQRRQDPSILTKTGANQYMLRIFPLPGTQSRTFKISYLTPAKLTSNKVMDVLPIEMLTTENNYSLTLEITTPKEECYGQPALLNQPLSTFHLAEKNNQKLWRSEYQFNGNDFTDQVVFNFNFKDGKYLSVFKENENEGYYQLAILPEIAVETKAPKKIFVLIDYDEYTTTFTKNEILSLLEQELYRKLNPKDSIMLMYSSLNIEPVRDSWIGADSVSLDALFNEIDENKITNYSNLPSLLAKALSMVNGSGNTEIFLLSSSINQGAYNSANNLFEDLHEITKTLPVIHTLAFCNRNLKYYYQGNRNYVGNEYFYTLLTRNTSGTMQLFDQNKPLEYAISQSILNITGRIYSPDLYTSTQDGFCYKRFDINLSDGAYAQNPIVQVGRYYGTPPFDISFSGVFENIPFSEHFSIHQTDIQSSDSTLRQFWAGEDILKLENQVYNTATSTNEWIQEIISLSMKNQVLSRYTAFLALEPGMDPEIDPEDNFDDQIDDEWAVEVENRVINQNPLITLKPNPFSSNVRIQVSLPDSISSQEIQHIKIVDAMGKLVKTFDPVEYENLQSFELNWQGDDMNGLRVKQGIYILIIAHKERIFTRKLVKQ